MQSYHPGVPGLTSLRKKQSVIATFDTRQMNPAKKLSMLISSRLRHVVAVPIWRRLVVGSDLARFGNMNRPRLRGLPHLSCIKRDRVDRRATPPRRVTSPTRGPPPPCKEAVIDNNILPVNCLVSFDF